MLHSLLRHGVWSYVGTINKAVLGRYASVWHHTRALRVKVHKFQNTTHQGTSIKWSIPFNLLINKISPSRVCPPALSLLTPWLPWQQHVSHSVSRENAPKKNFTHTKKKRRGINFYTPCRGAGFICGGREILSGWIKESSPHEKWCSICRDSHRIQIYLQHLHFK